MQGFILAATLVAKKHTIIFLHNTKNVYKSQWNMKYRSRERGHGLCLKSVSRTRRRETYILNMYTATKFCQWSIKYRSRVLGLGACVYSMSRIITIQLSQQCFIIPAIMGAKKHNILLNMNY